MEYGIGAATRALNEAPYRVIAMEHRTPATVEVWLQPVNEPMAYPPGEARSCWRIRCVDIPPRS